MTGPDPDRRARRLVTLLVILAAAVVVPMVALAVTWAVAFDGGVLAVVVAAVWAVGGVVLIGTLLRSLVSSDVLR